MLPNEFAVSPNLAAALTGRSDKHIRKLIADGVLPASGGNRPKVTLVDLAVLRGREISADEFMEAIRASERQREYWRSYQAHRRRWALDIGEQSGAVPQPT